MAEPWRRSPLPSNWRALREAVFKRDGYRCTWTSHGLRCKTTDTLECDHVGAHYIHSMRNLRTLCAYHHRLITSSQAGKEANRKKNSKKRKPESHPYFN